MNVGRRAPWACATWHRCKDSNPDERFWRPPCCHYITPIQPWWTRWDLNPQPSACKAGALPLSYMPVSRFRAWRRRQDLDPHISWFEARRSSIELRRHVPSGEENPPGRQLVGTVGLEPTPSSFAGKRSSVELRPGLLFSGAREGIRTLDLLLDRETRLSATLRRHLRFPADRQTTASRDPVARSEPGTGCGNRTRVATLKEWRARRCPNPAYGRFRGIWSGRAVTIRRRAVISRVLCH